MNFLVNSNGSPPSIAIETENEVRLHIRHVTQDHVHVIGDLTHFLGADIAAARL